MRLLFFILLFSICSCTAQGDLIKYTFLIKSNGELTVGQKEHLTNEIQSRLNNHGFRGSKVDMEENKLMVTSRVNLKNEKEKAIYQSLFRSNSLELWPTYRISDAEIEGIDSNNLAANDFEPFYRLEKGYYPYEVLGICRDGNKLNEISTMLSQQLYQIDNLKLIWSKETNAPLNEEEKYFGLYMVNTDGEDVAPIKEREIEKISLGEDDQTGSYAINIEFSEEASRKWSKMTEKAANDNNRGIAIVINDRVLTVPRVMSPIYSGDCMITGDYNKQEAEELVRSIAIGRLDYELELIDEEVLKEGR